MLQIGARAKINWTLDITGRRADGYHLMDMLMQSVTLADEITLEKTLDGEITLTTGGTPLLPADEHHLALRAARALQKAASCPLGARIHVEKRIPVGAGMGGGSSDAAGVLVGLNRLWETGLTRAELEDVGLTLGADVPFCIRGGLTRTRGIGEAMQELPCGQCFPLVVIQPCGGLSTRDVFAAYHAQAVSFRPDNDAAQAALAVQTEAGRSSISMAEAVEWMICLAISSAICSEVAVEAVERAVDSAVLAEVTSAVVSVRRALAEVVHAVEVI